MSEKKLYIYEGPIIQFDKCIQDYWRGGTQAVSEKQALSYLAYQFKRKKKLSIDNSKISLDSSCLRLG